MSYTISFTTIVFAIFLNKNMRYINRKRQKEILTHNGNQHISLFALFS